MCENHLSNNCFTCFETESTGNPFVFKFQRNVCCNCIDILKHGLIFDQSHKLGGIPQTCIICCKLFEIKENYYIHLENDDFQIVCNECHAYISKIGSSDTQPLDLSHHSKKESNNKLFNQNQQHEIKNCMSFY